jgi:hypothetical protein
VSNFEGRLFGGRLFAGQLFGRRRRTDTGGGGPDRSDISDADPRRFTDFTDDDLIQIGVALILSGAFDG